MHSRAKLEPVLLVARKSDFAGDKVPRPRPGRVDRTDVIHIEESSDTLDID